MLSGNLKYLREKKKLTQAELAKLLGVSRSTYSSYEKKTSEPTASLLLQLAQYYNVSTDHLLTEDLGAPLFHQNQKKEDHITYIEQYHKSEAHDLGC